MIQNPGFETQITTSAQPGTPAVWTVATVGTGEESVGFTGDAALVQFGYETFEHGWGIADPEALITTLVIADYRLPEDFLNWSINQGVLYLTTLESATFTSHTASLETFELWLSGGDVDFALTSLEVESITPETFAWASLVTGLGGAIDHVAFDAGASTFEQFNTRVNQQVSANPSTNKLTRVDAQDFVGSPGDYVTLVLINGSAPSPLISGDVYVIANVTGAAIQLLPSQDGTVIDLTDSGSGNLYVQADPDRFWTEEI